MDADFDSLVADILNNPERLLDPSISPEQIVELQKRLNPYAKTAGPQPSEEKVKIAAVSYTNLREDYLKRLVMTSMVGFMYRMYSEWEVPAEDRSWTPKSKKKIDKPTSREDQLNDLIKQLTIAQSVAKEALDATEQSKKLAESARSLELTNDSKVGDEEIWKEFNQAESKSVGLAYVAFHLSSACGKYSELFLRDTAVLGMKYPEVKQVIQDYPLPPAPGRLEMPQKISKKIIGGFLDHWLNFDPNKHVVSGYKAADIRKSVIESGGQPLVIDDGDPNHLTIDELTNNSYTIPDDYKKTSARIRSNPSYYNALTAMLKDDELMELSRTVQSDSASWKRILLPINKDHPARRSVDKVPPQDTFHRWNYYTEVNYEALRTITEALYPERPDLDWAIALWDSFEGTKEEVDAAFDKHCQKYQDELPSSVKALEFGYWSLLADFGENRKKMQFYNKNTEVLKRILDRHTEDKKLGSDLMRKRVRDAKAKNIREDGPDAPGLKQYRQHLAAAGKDLRSVNVEKVITAEEMRRLELAKGNIKAAKELELLEQYETTIKDLTHKKELHGLTTNEEADLKHALDNIEMAKEMVMVPDDAIQVDVFSTDSSTGKFSKTHFYTQSESPEHLDKSARGNNVASESS